MLVIISTIYQTFMQRCVGPSVFAILAQMVSSSIFLADPLPYRFLVFVAKQVHVLEHEGLHIQTIYRCEKSFLAKSIFGIRYSKF